MAEVAFDEDSERTSPELWNSVTDEGQITPLSRATQILSPKERAALWWFQSTAVIFFAMLDVGCYEDAAKAEYFHLYTHQALAALGPAPGRSSGSSPPIWRSFMTDDHTPIEYSWSWNAGRISPWTRFCIEPIPYTGTSHPSREVAWTRAMEVFDELRRTLSTVSSSPLHLDSQLFYAIAQCLRSSEPEVPEKESEAHPTVAFFGFDLLESDMRMKAYFILPPSLPPSARLELVSHLTSRTFPSQAWPCIHDYLKAFNEARATSAAPFMLAVDCVERDDARFKVYIRYPKSDFPQLLYQLSLGDQMPLSPSFVRSIREFWNLAFSLVESSSPGLNKDIPLTVYYDMTMQSGVPGVKVYFPIPRLRKNDMEAAVLIHEWLKEEEGFQKLGDSFVAMVQKLCPRPLAAANGFMTYLGIAQKTGGSWEPTLYINPQTMTRLS